MLIQAVSALLERQPTYAEKIKYVIYARTSLTNAPFGHGLVQRVIVRQGLRAASAFSLNLNKCASAVEALRLIDTLFKTDAAVESILMVTGDIAFTKQQRLLQNASLAGDAAAAMLFGRTPHQSNDLELVSVSKQVYPEFYQGSWLSPEKASEFEKRFPEMMSDLIQLTAKEAGVQLGNIRFILPHNVNVPIWKKIAEQIEVPFSKIYTRNIPMYGHCFTSDFLINCAAVRDELQSGELMLVANVGFGLTFCGAVFQKRMKQGE